MLTSLVLFAASCTPGDAPEPPTPSASQSADGGRLVFGVFGEPATLDPYSPVASDLTYALVRPLYPSLYRMSPNGAIEPQLAESIEIHGNRAVVVLEEWRWSNSRAVTARDVVRSIQRATPVSGFARVTSVRPRDARTVELRGIGIKDWEETLATLAFVLPGGRAGLVSGGPYRIAARTPGLQIVYERNPEWQGAASLDTITVRYAISTEMLIALLADDKLDAAWIPSTVNLGQRLDELGLEHSRRLGLELVYLDLEGWPASSTTRRAISRTIDLREIERGFVRGDGRVAEPFVRATKTEPSGSIRLAVPTGDELLEYVQRMLQVQMNSSDLDAELVTIDPERFYGSWVVDDPVDVALRRSTVPLSAAARADALAWPLFEVATTLAWRPGVSGLDPNPTVEGPLWNAEVWTVN